MNLRALLTTEEWDWMNHWAQGWGIGYQRGYAIGDSRKPKIVKDWARNYSHNKIIDDEYCEYKESDSRTKKVPVGQRVKR